MQIVNSQWRSGAEKHKQGKTMNADMKINHSRVTTYSLLFSTTSVGLAPVSPCLEQMLLLEQMQGGLQSLQRRKLGTVASPAYKSSKEMGKKGELAHQQKQI